MFYFTRYVGLFTFTIGALILATNLGKIPIERGKSIVGFRTNFKRLSVLCADVLEQNSDVVFLSHVLTIKTLSMLLEIA